MVSFRAETNLKENEGTKDRRVYHLKLKENLRTTRPCFFLLNCETPYRLGLPHKPQEYQTVGFTIQTSGIPDCRIYHTNLRSIRLSDLPHNPQEYQIVGFITKTSEISDCWIYHTNFRNIRLSDLSNKPQEY